MCLYAISIHPSCGHHYHSANPIPTTRCWRPRPCNPTPAAKEVIFSYVSPYDCRHCRAIRTRIPPPPQDPGIRYHPHARELDNVVDPTPYVQMRLSDDLMEVLAERVREVETRRRVRQWLEDVWETAGMERIEWNRALEEWRKCEKWMRIDLDGGVLK